MSASPARVASFDSASAMVRAVARYLHGRDFPALGQDRGPWFGPAMRALNMLPVKVRRELYAVGSGRERLSQSALAAADMDEISEPLLRQYPDRRYPGAVIGSTPGSIVHLCAAFGLPLLPQTLLLPLNSAGADIDDPHAHIEIARPAAQRLVENNPDIVVHHMVDPNEDRLTLRWFTYFRVKRQKLGRAYERFLLDHLEPGGTILLSDSQHCWPTSLVGDRHIFQLGGVSGVTPQEYLEGSPRIADFLRRHGAGRDKWQAPSPDADRREAEWGFDPALGEDVIRFAEQHGFRVRRVSFDEADDLSPFVADLYRWWYRRRHLPADRLHVESFVLLDPWWTLRAGAVPFWITFNGSPGADTLESYLGKTDPYDAITIALIANGIDSIGLAPLQRWDDIVRAAGARGGVRGVDRAKYPADFATFTRYREALLESDRRWPMPEPLETADLDRFLQEMDADPEVRITDER